MKLCSETSLSSFSMQKWICGDGGGGKRGRLRTESRGVALVCVAVEAMDTGRGRQGIPRSDNTCGRWGWRVPRKHPANWCWWCHSVSIKNIGKEPYLVLKNSSSAVLLFGCVWLSSHPAASALRPPRRHHVGDLEYETQTLSVLEGPSRYQTGQVA